MTPFLVCEPVYACASEVTCTSSSNSKCSSCAKGYYLDKSGPVAKCPSTFFFPFEFLKHLECTFVAGCTSSVVCTTSYDSHCDGCGAGFYRKASNKTYECVSMWKETTVPFVVITIQDVNLCLDVLPKSRVPTLLTANVRVALLGTTWTRVYVTVCIFFSHLRDLI